MFLKSSSTSGVQLLIRLKTSQFTNLDECYILLSQIKSLTFGGFTNQMYDTLAMHTVLYKQRMQNRVEK